MNICIIGAGNVGGALGRIWASKGHAIIFGVRNPDSINTKHSLELSGGIAKAYFIKEAVKMADVIVLATPWEAVPEVVFQILDLHDKILIDCTNPIRPNPEWPLSQETSAAEEIAKRLPGFKVVKAFNTIGAANFGDVHFGTEQADGFMCGDDVKAKEIAAQLANDAGLHAVDVGGLRNAELLEAMAKLWTAIAYQQGIGPKIAFKLLQR